MKPKAELVKIVKMPDGVRYDEKQKMFGRGAYICKNAECINAATKRRAISKHFKMPVDEEIYKIISEANEDG